MFFKDNQLFSIRKLFLFKVIIVRKHRTTFCNKHIIFDNNTLWSKCIKVTIFTNKNALIIQNSYPPTIFTSQGL